MKIRSVLFALLLGAPLTAFCNVHELPFTQSGNLITVDLNSIPSATKQYINQVWVIMCRYNTIGLSDEFTRSTYNMMGVNITGENRSLNGRMTRFYNNLYVKWGNGYIDLSYGSYGYRVIEFDYYELYPVRPTQLTFKNEGKQPNNHYYLTGCWAYPGYS